MVSEGLVHGRSVFGEACSGGLSSCHQRQEAEEPVLTQRPTLSNWISPPEITSISQDSITSAVGTKHEPWGQGHSHQSTREGDLAGQDKDTDMAFFFCKGPFPMTAGPDSLSSKLGLQCMEPETDLQPFR